MDKLTRSGSCGRSSTLLSATFTLLVTVLGLASGYNRAERTYQREPRLKSGTTIPSTTPAGYVNVDIAMQNMTKYSGESVRILCEISGDPLPHYSWLKDGEALQENARIKSKTTTWGCRLKISELMLSDSGFYTCEGRNHYGQRRTTGYLHVKKGKKARTPAPKSTTGPQRQSYEPHSFIQQPNWKPNKKGYCQLYRGAACGQFMSNKKIYVMHNHQQYYIDEKVSAMMTLLGSSSHSKHCGDYLIKALCYYELPLCNDTGGKARPQKLCRDECEALQNDVCAAEYKSTAKTAGYVNSAWLPDCSKLPVAGSDEAEVCVPIGIPVRGKVNPDHTCYNNTGQEYLGTQDHTTPGHTCLKWMSVNPKQRSSSSYSYLGNHNYCRNPKGEELGPWCFTKSSNGKPELCSIPQCSVHQEPGLSDLMMIIIPSITVPLVIATVVIIFCIIRCNSSSPGKGFKQPSQQLELGSVTGKAGSKAREFGISALRFYQEIGGNRFGKVYRGELIGYCNDKTPVPVAVKTLKERAPAKLQNEFRKEMEIMSEIRHPNVSCLLGVVSREEPNCIIYEYLPHGNLHEYLQCHSPHSDVSVSDDNGTDSILEMHEMVHIAVQLAAAMEYLSNQKYIHKDLATRNILVGNNLLIKISDFDTCKDTYSSDYYCVQGKQPWPIRWMPPEAIKHGHFTSESDVWSYGVVLWEVFSFGLQPYYGYSNQEVLELVTVRQLLPCPEDCPAHIYSIMVECWQEMPIRRPSFRELLGRLRSWRCDLYGNPVVARSIAHSTSTHHSGHSGQHSHHSSTGPSNNTATTGLTSVSQHGPTVNASNNQFNLANKPIIQPLPTPLPPPPMPHSMVSRMPLLNPSGSNSLYRKPSPPGSTVSNKSSSLHSDQSPTSSISNYKFLVQNNLNQPLVVQGNNSNKFEPIPNGHAIPNGTTTFGVPQYAPANSAASSSVEPRTCNM